MDIDNNVCCNYNNGFVMVSIFGRSMKTLVERASESRVKQATARAKMEENRGCAIRARCAALWLEMSMRYEAMLAKTGPGNELSSYRSIDQGYGRPIDDLHKTRIRGGRRKIRGP